MAGDQHELDRAAATHRLAAALVAAVGEQHHSAPAAGPPGPPGANPSTARRRVRELAQRLRSAAALLAPSWLGVALETTTAPASAAPVGGTAATGGLPAAGLIRLGTALPLDDASFPVVAPLGQLSLDADATDHRVAGLLHALLLRLLANAQPGAVLIRVVDAVEDRFTRFAPLHGCGIMAPAATHRDGMRALLTEAEQWVASRAGATGRKLVLVVCGWPAGTGVAEADRLAALADAGASTGLHLLVAGRPAGQDRALPGATRVTLRSRYARVRLPAAPAAPSPATAASLAPAPSPTHAPAGWPRRAGRSTPGRIAVPAPGGTPPAPDLDLPDPGSDLLGPHTPVALDGPPPAELITRVCTALAGRVGQDAELPLATLLPADPPAAADRETGLSVVLGHASGGPVRLRLAEPTPHWLVVGRGGSGRTALLLDILYGLCARYDPERLTVHLLDLGNRRALAGAVAGPGDDPPRSPVVATERSQGLALLRSLVGQLAGQPGGQQRRLVCLVDEVGELLRGDDRAAGEAAQLLSTLTERGGSCGVHLVLTSRDTAPAAVAARCRVRIALPGGAAALDTANAAAAGLAPGTAVVNTAGGLGGPRGATRAHERLVRFPDPYPDRAALAGLADRLWRTAAPAGGGTIPGGAR